jgi:hypothetical protein
VFRCFESQVYVFLLSHMFHMPRQSHPRFYQSNNIS